MKHEEFVKALKNKGTLIPVTAGGAWVMWTTDVSRDLETVLMTSSRHRTGSLHPAG